MAPARHISAEPGFIAAIPPHLRLVVGQRAHLTAKLYESNGTVSAAQPAAWMFTPDTLGVAHVSDQGDVVATTPGVTTVSVSDGVHGVRPVTVQVFEQPPDPEVSFAFDPPLMMLAEGESRPIVVRSFDDIGNETDATPMLQVDGEAAVTLTDGVLYGSSSGAATLRALGADGQELGALYVLVFPSGQSPTHAGPDPTEGCADWNRSCTVLSPPHVATRPGLRTELRIQGWRYRSCGSSFRGEFVEREPSRVVVDAPGVVEIDSDGMLASIAPGTVRMQFEWDGATCNPMSRALCADVRVMPDLRGCWTFTCDGGDRGWVRIPGYNWPSGWWKGTRIGIHGNAFGSSSLTNSKDGFACQADDGATAFTIMPALGSTCSHWDPTFPEGKSGGACTSDRPCHGGPVPAHCAPGRDGAGRTGDVLGPDTMASGTCHFVRQTATPAVGCTPDPTDFAERQVELMQSGASSDEAAAKLLITKPQFATLESSGIQVAATYEDLRADFDKKYAGVLAWENNWASCYLVGTRLAQQGVVSGYPAASGLRLAYDCNGASGNDVGGSCYFDSCCITSSCPPGSASNCDYLCRSPLQCFGPGGNECSRPEPLLADSVILIDGNWRYSG